MKKAIILFFAGCLAVFCGCAHQDFEPNESQESEIVYADQEFIGALSQALQARFDFADAVDETTAESLAETVSVEIEKLTPYKTRQFEDAKLQEKFLSYLNLLEESKELTKDMGVNDDTFYNDWDSLYNERTVMLKDFVDNYGLTVDAAHQETLDDLLRRGQAVEKADSERDAVEQLAASLNFDKASDEEGLFFTYTAIGENDTELNLEDVSLVLALYDEDGVKVEETYAGTNSWPKGEKVKFEAMSDVDAAEIKVSLDYYAVVD